jgi:hypothetical protein
VARFLSGPWFQEVAAAGEAAPERPVLILQQVVTGTPEGDVRYHVAVGDGRAVLAPGQAEHPDATFTQDYATAVAVARGEIATQTALLAGRIVVAGDMGSLSLQHDSLTDLDPLTEAVRTATTF